MRETKEEMEQAAEEYARTKEVIILGEVKNGKFVDQEKKKKRKKKST